ncbi:MAG TPA: hypothetical protein EYP64_00405 [Desulfarculaceae bacterium]|nr:hypothetical protein [Desulfarculaceae bacterium]
MKENKAEDFLKFALGLSKLRRRRWFLLGVIMTYVPFIWLSPRLTNLGCQPGKVFVVWFLFVLVSSILVAVGKCPRCGNFFHIKELSPLYLRSRCLHCGLHIKADKKQHNERT